MVARTKYGKAFALGIVFVMLFAPLPASGSRSQALTLTSRTKAEAISTGYSLVRLPKQVFVDEGFDVRVTGSGRAYGFALVQDDDSVRPGEGAELYGFHTGFCNTMACEGSKPHETPIWGHNLGRRGDRSYLPASTFRLYAITDGSRVEIEIEIVIPGLEHGTQTIALDRPAKAKVSTPKTWYQETASNTLMSAGQQRPFGGPGVAFLTLWHRGEMTAGSAIGDCEYETEPPPGELAYLPGCPVADYGVVRTNDPRSEPYTAYRTVSYSYLPRAIGMYYVSPVGVEHAGVVSLWLSYR